ncbi:SpoIIE family protein phosphatase [Salinispirillum sp. LH 10-3-1]|uniref:SpoIIE family protein phosphatase n=1 Tax=Salinispirillum sp. LH 10-3-1 TaxID=2952525 RepID=A0AB38YJV4_9GAMM
MTSSQPQTNDDALQFAEENPSDDGLHVWKILIVDDEPEVHQVTRMALREFRFQNHRAEFYSAYSGSEARAVLEQQDDIALILLDVVMESEDAGLNLARHIRDTIGNKLIRIILRTGQPGQAPEQRVVLQYDINDYRSKTEMTAQRLITSVVSALRSYIAIKDLDVLNSNLEAQVAERTQELQAAHDKLQASLTELEEGERAGKRVQFKLLPPREQRFGEYCFSHKLKPSEFMSGDFLDYFVIDADRVAFYIADVSGHGVASAFVTVYLKRFMSTCLDTYLREGTGSIENPAEVLSALNAELLRENMTKYIALFYGVLDIRTHELTYSNAGAYPWPLLRYPSRPAEYLELKSTPAGMFDFATYQNHQMSLPDDFCLFLFSDGIMDLLDEPTNDAKLAYLSEQLCTPDATVDQIIEALDLPSRPAMPDDLTLLKLERRSAQ